MAGSLLSSLRHTTTHQQHFRLNYKSNFYYSSNVLQNLFQEQKNPWVPYNPYVSKFNEIPTQPASTSTLSDADEGIVEVDDEYVEEDEDTFRKRQDLVNPNSYGGRQTHSQSDMMRKNNNPYKVSMDRNPDSFRIPPTRNKLQLTYSLPDVSFGDTITNTLSVKYY